MGRLLGLARSVTLRADQRLLEVTEHWDGRDLVLRVEGHRPLSEPDYDDAWLLTLIRDSNTFLDLGCSVGLFTVLAALDPGRRIVAVDANSRALQTCATNLIANGIADRVTFLTGFLGADEIGAWVPDERLVDEGFAPHDGLEVPRRSIDGIVDQLGVAPDLVKLDIEGAEADALRGGTRTASVHGPRFHVEVHSVPDLTMAENGALILEWCTANGYEAWYLAEHLRLTDVGPIRDRGRCHLLLQPEGAAYPEALAGIAQGMAITELPASR